MDDRRVPNRSRQAMMVVLVVMGLAVPLIVAAQEVPDVRVGVGLNSPDTPQRWGQHALVDISTSLRPWLALRGTGFFSWDRHFSVGRRLTGGVDVGVVVVSHELPLRPYFGGLVGYTHTPLSASRPLGHDIGLGTVMGFELSEEGGWFIEARLRYFGNLFMERSVTKSLHLLTIGRRL